MIMNNRLKLFLLLSTFFYQILADTSGEYYTFPRIIFSIIVFVVGLLFATAGYRFSKLIVVLAGFFTFSIFTYLLLQSIFGIEWYWNLLISIISGLLGAVIFHCLLYVAFFFLGAIFGFLMTTVLMGFVNNWVGTTTATSTWFIVTSWVIIVVVSILFGLLTLKFQRLLIIISTSIMGCFLIVFAFDYIVGDGAFSNILINLFNGDYNSFADNAWIPYLMVVLWIVLSVAAVIVQYRVTAKDYSLNHQPNGNVLYIN